MGFVETLALAVALAMDAFAVAVGTGVTLREVSGRQVFRLAWHFGLFQALMPLAGWAAGLTIQRFVSIYAPWLAFALLALVGTRMVWGAFHPEAEKEKRDPTRGLSLVMLSVATSIDALAVGLGLSLMRISVWFPALVIGLVASAFTAAGLRIGKAFGSSSRLTSWAEVLGGAVLLAIGFKILSGR